MTEYITLDQYAMGRDKLYPDEWKVAISNAVRFLPLLNHYLAASKVIGPLTVSSGFRPIAINSKVSGAAKSSLHLVGKACDIADPDGRLRELLDSTLPADELERQMRAGRLKMYGLFMEHPSFTPGWLHIDCGERIDRPSRTFQPR